MLLIKWLAVMLVTIVTNVIASDERSRSFFAETRQNYALDFTAFQTLQTNGLLECASMCLKISLCFYFNFQISHDNGLCQVCKGILHHRKAQLEGLIQPKTGYVFGQVVSKVKKQNI